MKTNEITNQNNKNPEQNLIQSIKRMPIISKHFQDAFRLVHDENFDKPIVELTKNQKSKITKLIE